MMTLKGLKSFLTGRRKSDPVVEKLLSIVIAQSRDPVFFRDLNVPDTLDGRFDVLVLHLYLALKRLKSESAAARDTAQRLFDAFLVDLDVNLRAAGVSDIRIGKEMKKRVADIYGRMEAYDRGLDGRNYESLRDSLDRNLYQKTEARPVDLDVLATYLHDQWTHLESLPVETILAGRLEFGPMPRPG